MPDTVQAVTEREQRMAGLLRRMLCLSEQQRGQVECLEGLVERLGVTCRVLQEQLERSEADRAAERTATEFVIGEAMDELLERKTD